MGAYPKEIFIHAKTRFNMEEWKAFQEVTPSGTNLVGVTIQNKPLKLFKSEGNYPIMRGNAFVVNERELLFSGVLDMFPKTQSTLSMEVPNPIFIEINKGSRHCTSVKRYF